MRYFADCHFHAMTMDHPNFAAFFASFYDSATGLLTANATQNYILTPQMLRGNNLLYTLENTLTAFERPIGETYMMMEDDLADIENYSKTRKPAMGGSYEEVVRAFISERQRAMLRKMINFKFTLHHRYNLPKSRLKTIEKFLQSRVRELLEL